MDIEIGMDRTAREGVVKVLKTLLAATYAFYTHPL